MTTYRYRPHRRMTPGQQAAAVGIGAVLVLGAAKSTHHHHGHGGSPAASSSMVTQAIAYARHQLGKPYCWSGTGPSCYDCSGLMQMAYRSAGVAIPRTSELQWADGHRVSHPERGDLVFFAGSDGTPASPGHVALVLGPHRMIEAYAAGFPIRVSSFGLPTSPEGDVSPVGFTDPTWRPR